MSRVAVLGLGVTGDAVVRWAAAPATSGRRRGGRRPARRRDRRPTRDVCAGAGRSGVGHADRRRSRLRSSPASTCSCRVPGVPERHPLTRRRARVPVCRCGREVDLAAEVARGTSGRVLVAITGTNGKTTVTELTVAMLRGVRRRRGGRRQHRYAVARRGGPRRSAGRAGPVVVAEVSSFQLALDDGGVPSARGRAAEPCRRPSRLAPHVPGLRRGEGQASSPRRDPTTCSCSTPTIPWSRRSPPMRPGRTRAFSVVDGAAAGFRIVHSAGGSVLVAADGTELGPRT